MNQLIQVLVSGLGTGAVYGLVALGFTLGFAVTKVINFAHGELLMAAVMVTAAVTRGGGGVGVAIVAGLATATLLGVVLDLVTIRPVLKRDREGFGWLVTTLGAAIVLSNVAGMIWGSQSYDFPALLSQDTFRIGAVTASWQQVLGLVLLLGIGIGCEVMRRRSRAGSVASAVALDPEMASAVGIRPRRVELFAFAFAGLLAGVAGMVVAPLAFANSTMGIGYAVKGFVALMIGGLGSIPGAIVGGLTLGIAEAAAATWIGSGAVDWFPYAVLAVVLALLPKGIFGGREAVAAA